MKYTSARGCLSCVVVLSKPSVVHCLKCNFQLALLLSDNNHIEKDNF